MKDKKSHSDKNDPKEKQQKPAQNSSETGKQEESSKHNAEKNSNDQDVDKQKPVRKEKVTNEDNKVTNKDAQVTNEEVEEDGDKLKPGKTTDPEISPEEKKEIRTKIHTSPGNDNIPE